MKTISVSKLKRDQNTGIEPEYKFDYAKAQLNRFASKEPETSLTIMLDPDVAHVFRDAESVNTVLRALLTTMPARRIRGTR
jgi:hypothetical protein